MTTSLALFDPGNTIPGYLAEQCQLLDTAWLTSWAFTCIINGISACINELAHSSLFASCREIGLRKIEHKLTVFLQDFDTDKFAFIGDCLSTPCGDIAESRAHAREKEACHVIHSRESVTNWIKGLFIPPEWKDMQEFLRFRNDDPREKLLYLSAEYDHNGALNPALISSILSQFSQKYDLKYSVVKTPEEICASIERSKKTGKLAHVVINGHGNRKLLAVGNHSDISWRDLFWQWQDHTECFSGVHPSGKVVLFSCSTGSKNNITNTPFDNIAQKIANEAKRVVVAPKNLVNPRDTSLLSTETAMLFQQENLLYSFLPFYNVNLFRLFKPHYTKFSEIKNDKIHDRDLFAAKEIQKDLASKSLVSDMDETNGLKEHLSFCKDDPRDKVLYLVADADKNGALNPHLVSEVLSILSDKFDLKYKTIFSSEEMCQEISKASKFGNVVAVIVEAHGTPSEGMLLSKDWTEVENRITTQSNFSCFSKLKRNGAIVLFGGSVGQKSTSPNNLAQKIANISRRTVLAPTCHLYPESIEVHSIEPLILYHPQHSSFNSWWKNCPENGENIFKVFDPKIKG